jgi:glycosyltransferase involved in cell wall biosynthesis
VRRNEIDVVHTHLTRAAYIGHALGILTGVPIITSVHIANNDQIYRRLARKRNRLVAVSNFVAGMLHGRGVPRGFIDTVYNGTDFVGIDRRTDPREVMDEFGIPHDRHIVGLVGKVCRDKGQVELIHAMGAIKSQHAQAHLMFVGLVDPPYRPAVEDAIARHGLKDRVTFTGVREDIPRLLDSFTLSTLPSYMETFGLAVIEAMARSKAVVASRAGALPEVVRDKQTGLLVDLRPDSIAEALSLLLDDRELRDDMGRRGRRLVEQKFTLDQMVDRFEEVYARAVES